MSEKRIIGIADMKLSKVEGMLVTYALGSCIGICLHDPVIKLGALVHIMLPLNMETGRKNPMKYADTGIRETLRQMEAMGARRDRITAKIPYLALRREQRAVLRALLRPPGADYLRYKLKGVLGNAGR